MSKLARRRGSMKLGLAASLLLLSATLVGAHGIPTLGERPVDWHTDQISRTMTVGDGREGGQIVMLDGQQCLAGRYFSFDVDDRYAFDIDETVQVEVQFYQHREAATPELSYEKNGEAEAAVRGLIPAYQGGARAHNVTFALERARFANRGWFLTDFSIGSGGKFWTSKQNITICDISLKRAHRAVAPKDLGTVAIEVSDETGETVPVRVGIYDRTKRLPLPSKEAIAVQRGDESVRVMTLNPQVIPWPASNPSGFYINGSYHAKLPVG